MAGRLIRFGTRDTCPALSHKPVKKNSTVRIIVEQAPIRTRTARLLGSSTAFLKNTSIITNEETQFCGRFLSLGSAYVNQALLCFSTYLTFSPAKVGNIGDTEREEVAWCTKSGRGTRVIPDGTLKGVHFVHTPDYVQVTGVGDFTKINIPAGDSGGELDNRGADGRGNPSMWSCSVFLLS